MYVCSCLLTFPVPLHQLTGVFKFCRVARPVTTSDWNGKRPAAISCAVHEHTNTQHIYTHTSTRRRRVSEQMGWRKKRAFKLSPLGPVSVIMDGILSKEPIMLVSIASPPQLVNTQTLTHTGSFRCLEKKVLGMCKSVFVASLFL